MTWRLSEKSRNPLKTTNMATTSRNIAEELLGNIPMLNTFQLRALVPYLSPEDATTIEDFKLSELAEDYYVETINLRYGKLENKNHLFDMFAKYCGYDDSTYARLDMLTFVAENTARYEWNAHVLLKMHGTNLDGWVKTMTDCLNRGNELAIYAICDMLKRHAFVFTRTKPWTTVDGSIGTLTVPELCMMCDVRLIYLGNNKFGEIKCKPELLSPLPKPKPFKKEPSPRTVASPNEELVVGILDESQSSCTLVSLPCSPETTKIELAKQDISMKLAEDPLESNDTTRPVETSAVTTTNESQLDPPPAPTTNPTSPSISDQTLTNEPPISNESKPETIDGPPSSNQQVETERPVTPAEKITKDEPVGNNVSTTQATTPETKEDGTAENEQDKTNEPHKPGVESEPIEQPSLTQ